MKRLLSAALVSGALCMAPLTASAATVLGSAFPFGGNVYNWSDAGVTGTFTGSANFTQKTKPGWTGVGIAGGRTNDEIDIGESITGVFTSSTVRVGAFQLMVLYDGPEFGDVQEKAQVTATLADNSVLVGVLTIAYDSTTAGAGTLNSFWSLGGATVTNLSPAIDPGGAAVWRVQNPFGTADIKSLSFTALAGLSANICPPNGNSNCTNQSDYALERIEVLASPAEIPEPGTYALMLAGLGMLGLMVRRRTTV